jgi:choline dehydrogenase-like flavoprotein
MILKSSGVYLALALAVSPSADAFAYPGTFVPQKYRTSGTPLHASASEDDYDFIVCGMGYAGAIITARLAQRNPDKKILAIEYGGPVQAKTGGATRDDSDINWTADMFQNEGMREGKASKYDPTDPLCMPDVPGNYNNVAFRALSEHYMLPEFDACFQGTGLGGNGVYNGALYQEPANWWWDDENENRVHTDIFVSPEEQAQGKKTSDILKPYYAKVQDVLKDAIKTTPSMDGIHYTQ